MRKAYKKANCKRTKTLRLKAVWIISQENFLEERNSRLTA